MDGAHPIQDTERLRARILRQLNIVGMSDAEKDDVAQEVFLALLTTQDRVRHVENWVTAVARRKAFAMLRRRNRFARVELDRVEEPSVNAVAELYIDVHRALATSRIKVRNLFLERYLEQRGAEELAVRARTSPSTVKRRIKLERERLRRRLGD